MSSPTITPKLDHLRDVVLTGRAGTAMALVWNGTQWAVRRVFLADNYANTVIGDHSTVFSDETNHPAFELDVPGRLFKVFDEGSNLKIALDGVTGNVNLDGQLTAAVLEGVLSVDWLDGIISSANLPPVAITDVFTVASQAAMLALTAQRGDVAVRTDNGKTYILSTDFANNLADWKEIMAIGVVQSVNGLTGAITNVAFTNVPTTFSNTLTATQFIGERNRAGMTWRSSSALTVDTSPVWTSTVPYDATITDVVLKADVSTTSSVEVWVDGTKVSASDPATLSAATSSVKTSFTGWTLNVNKNSLIQVKLVSNNNATMLSCDVYYKHR